MDWSYSDRSQVSVEDYEDERNKRPYYIRRLGKTPLHKVKRNAILKDWAYTDDEVGAAKEELKRLRRNRYLTNFTSCIPWRIEYVFEKMKKKLLRKKSRAQRK